MNTMSLGVVAQATDHEVAEGSTGSRWSGVGVAAAVALAAAFVGLAFRVPFVALGIPAAMITGWWLGPKVRSTEGIVGMALAMATTTVALADALVVSGSAISAVVGAGRFGGPSLLEMLAGAVFMWGIGLIVVGIPMLLVTVPCGLIWAALVRRLGATGSRP